MDDYDLILRVLSSEKFARWYEDKFIPNYIEDIKVSPKEIKSDIKGLFPFAPLDI
jgi:hypothetical protein